MTRWATLLAAAAALPLASCGRQPATTPANSVAALTAGERTRVDAQLVAMGPDGWHRLALYGNWDFTEPEVWRWIVTQPECDRATALAIFWKAQPEYYLQYARAEDVPEAERDGYALITLIRDRWAAGRYRRAELAFDPDADAWPIDRAALVRRHGERVEQLMPSTMRVSLPGRRIAERDGPPLPGVWQG